MAVDGDFVTEVVYTVVAQLSPFGVGESSAYLDGGRGVGLEPLAATQGTVEAAGEGNGEADLVGMKVADNGFQ